VIHKDIQYDTTQGQVKVMEVRKL